MKKILLAMLIVACTALLSACGTEQTEFELGETFEFDGLEITISEDIRFGRIRDNWSSHDGEYYFYLPITVTNISDESHGLMSFLFTFFGPNGNEIPDISFYFLDESVTREGSMQPGATLEGYIHSLHTGDGEYIIEFDNFEVTLQVIFELEFDFDAIPEVQTVFALGETFEFDDLEITIGNNISWGTIDSRWSDLDGETYFYLPVTITNIGDSSNSLGSWAFDIFGPRGIALESITWDVEGDDITREPDIRPGVTVSGNLHILFDGDGEYLLEFNTWGSDEIQVFFNVTR